MYVFINLFIEVILKFILFKNVVLSQVLVLLVQIHIIRNILSYQNLRGLRFSKIKHNFYF